jgi:carboxypeptidase Q
VQRAEYKVLSLAAAALFAAAVSVSAQETNADRLIASELASSQAYETLAHITDHIGPRLSGSKGAAAAVTWTTERFRAWGIDVHTEPVMVPHWVRGREEAQLVSHMSQRLVVTALGGSVATSSRGITADVIEVNDFDELKALGAKIKGKIVYYNNPMDMELVHSGRAFEAYRKAQLFRGAGPSRAAELGAVAVLIRSIGSASLRTPHTGSLRYDPKQPKIPAAALTAEDAMLIDRLSKRGETVRVHLVLTPRELPDVQSFNVVAEIKGSELPNEIVLIGGHLDSWDLGTGAIDDGSGVAMVMETMRLLKQLNIQPRRTIRCVLFMNEENGLRGGRQYFADHKNDKHIAAVETDAGAAAPTGFSTTLKGAPLEAFEARAKSLAKLGAAKFETTSQTGADTSFLIEAGVAGFSLIPDPLHYFDYHHTPADTLDKVDAKELAQDAAAIAAIAITLADGGV